MSDMIPPLWPAPGTKLAGAWSFVSASSKGDAARLVIDDGAGRKITLNFALPGNDGKRAPIEVGGVRVFYEATPVPFAAFLPAAKALATIAAQASGADFPGALRQWLAATPKTEMAGQKPVGERTETLRIGNGASLSAALERAHALRDRPGAIGMVEVLDGASFEELRQIFDAVAIDKREFAIKVDAQAIDDDRAVGLLARLAGHRRFEIRFPAGDPDLARRVVQRLPEALRPELVAGLHEASAHELVQLGVLARTLKGSGRAYLAVDLPPAARES